MQDYPELKFTYNWNNKLECTAFTTIRISPKYKVGDKYRIYLNNDYKGLARIVAVKGLLVEQMTETMALIDTAYTKAETINILKNMYKTYDFQTKPIYHITLLFENKLPKL